MYFQANLWDSSLVTLSGHLSSVGASSLAIQAGYLTMHSEPSSDLTYSHSGSFDVSGATGSSLYGFLVSGSSPFSKAASSSAFYLGVFLCYIRC